VVFSSASAKAIAGHWVNLGYQQPPDATFARLLRYQDPRILQRVWHALSAAQRKCWLGPVVQWWTLTQPWGPWEPAQFVNGGPSPSDADAQAPWSCVVMPTPEELREAGSPSSTPFVRALFSPAQWQLAHVTPAANQVWAGYADAQVPPRNQPDGNTMLRLLADGQRLGLAGPNLHDYVWCTWQHNAPEGRERELSWQSPRAASVLAHVVQALRRQLESRFADLYLDVLKQRPA
jgi:hypothetical protein